MVKLYQLHRPELSIARALVVISDACSTARGMHPGQQAHAYRTAIADLLPTDARDSGEAWEPGEHADPDDWARLGAYLGAIDGRAQAPARMREPASHMARAAYAIAYSMAYQCAAWQSISSWSGQGVRHG